MATMLSLLTDYVGRRLAESHRTREIERLREKRKTSIQSYKNGNPFERVMDKHYIETIVHLGLMESAYYEDFTPDLLIVTEMQYKVMFDVPAAVSINPDNWPDVLSQSTFASDRERVEPPQLYEAGSFEIYTVPSSSVDGLTLIDMSDI